MSSLLFEWDPKKAETNLLKHRLSFELAAEVFNQERVLSFQSSQDNHGERREVAIGAVEGVFLFVVFTMREGRIRIISARKANRDEVRGYYDYFTTTAAGDPSKDEGGGD